MGRKVIIFFKHCSGAIHSGAHIKGFILAVASAVLLGACAGVQQIEPLEVKKKVVKKSALQVALEKPVILLLSSDSRVYLDVAAEIQKQSSRKMKRYQLTGKHQDDAKILHNIEAEKNDQLVAIGLLAAKAASKLKNKQVIFSQVTNYQEHDLIKPWMKGVDVLPSPQQLFADWKLLEPELSKVAIITGNNMSRYIESAKMAAKEYKIQLVHQEVSNDKEFLYASKHLKKDVQGQWIVADNRILSVNVLKEVLSFNAREGKHTVVFSPSLLSFGGLFYVQATEQEVSRQINLRLQQSAAKKIIPGQDVFLLMTHQMGINATVAKRFGIKIPDSYLKYIHD